MCISRRPPIPLLPRIYLLWVVFGGSMKWLPTWNSLQHNQEWNKYHKSNRQINLAKNNTHTHTHNIQSHAFIGVAIECAHSPNKSLTKEHANVKITSIRFDSIGIRSFRFSILVRSCLSLFSVYSMSEYTRFAFSQSVIILITTTTTANSGTDNETLGASFVSRSWCLLLYMYVCVSVCECKTCILRLAHSNGEFILNREKRKRKVIERSVVNGPTACKHSIAFDSLQLNMSTASTL